MLVMVVDVAGSELEPRASVTVRDGFLDLPNFLTKRFISLNSRFWCSMCGRSRWVMKVKMLWVI